MIESYDFGKIEIMGDEYSHDIMIIDSNVKPWIRETAHDLYLKDLQKDVEEKDLNLCEILIVGTGYEGCIEVQNDLKKFCKKKKIELFIDRTIIAIEHFNSIVHSGKRVYAIFHVTC